MEPKEAIKLLLDAIKASVLPHAEGYETALGARQTLVVCRHGHWRGMWHFAHGKYGWTHAGSREAEFETASVDEAVKYCLDHIFLE